MMASDTKLTHRGQRELFVVMLERTPALNREEPNLPEVDEAWLEVARALNCLINGPMRSTLGWREDMNRWRSTLIERTHRRRAVRRNVLSDLEIRALRAWGFVQDAEPEPPPPIEPPTEVVLPGQPSARATPPRWDGVYISGSISPVQCCGGKHIEYHEDICTTPSL